MACGAAVCRKTQRKRASTLRILARHADHLGRMLSSTLGPSPAARLRTFHVLHSADFARDVFAGCVSANRERDMRRAITRDFETFCSHLEIVPTEGPRRRFELNPMQRLYRSRRTARDVVLKARQMGMTTLAQAEDAYHFITRPGARVTMMVQSIDDADSPARKAKRVFDVFFESLAQKGLPLRFGQSPAGVWTLPERDSVLRIVEAGASLKAAQKKGRGDTVTRLHVTEQAFWEFPSESLLAVESSVVAPEKGGEILKESTPNGVGGKFYDDVQAAKGGTSGYALHFFPWFLEPEYRVALEPGEAIAPQTDREHQCVAQGVTPEQLKWYRRKVAEKGSQEKVDQEFPSDPDTCFLLSGRTFFSVQRIEELRRAALTARPIEVIPVRGDGANGEIRIWVKPSSASRYVLALDPSEGTGGDPGAGTIREFGSALHCATIHGQFKPHALAKIAAEWGKRFATAVIAVERNNHGHAVLQALEREHHYPKIFKHYDHKPGWLNNEVTRTKALAELDEGLRSGAWTTTDDAILAELRTFITTAQGRVEAARGSHDDLVLCEAIAFDVLKKPAVFVTATGGGY